MTSTRLRQIAQLIESQCVEIRTLKRQPERMPCNQCGTVARELCEMAREMDQAKEPKPIEDQRPWAIRKRLLQPAR